MPNEQTQQTITLDDMVRQTLQRTLDEKLPKMLEEAVEKTTRETIEDAFRWGDTRNAIRECVDSILIPAIENVNVNHLNTKLTQVLNEVFEQTSAADTRTIIQNFAGLMVEDDQPVKASELLKMFAEQCARDIDCDGREVTFDASEPQYASFVVEAEINELSYQYNYSRNLEDAVLELRIDDDCATDKDAEDKMCRELRLWRLDNLDEPNQWRVSASSIPHVAIRDLRRMSPLDIALMRMDHGDVRLLDDLDYRNNCIDVIPESTPEVTVE